MLTLATTCLGVITNLLISQQINGHYFVSFNTGIPTACEPTVQIIRKHKDAGYFKIVGEYRSHKWAVHDHIFNREVVLKIKAK